MIELFRIFSDFDNVRVVSMAVACIIPLLYIGFVFQNAYVANVRLTNTQTVLVTALGVFSLISGIIALGFLATPKNAESLLEIMHVRWLIDAYSREMQKLILWLLRAMS